MKIEYKSLNDAPYKEVSYHHPHPCGSGPIPCCPRITRWRLVSVMVVMLLSVVFLTFRCLQPGFLRRSWCCLQQIQPVGVRMGTNEFDYDGTRFSDKIRYKHTKRRLPQCLIIGVRKGGTRAVLEFLNLHPGIQAEKREMHFFDDEDNYSLGLEWYRKKMPYSFPDQITIEKTPAYFVSEMAPERAYKMNRGLKLIVVVRDPTERAISDYTQIHANKLEKNKPHESFEELALDAETGEIRRTYNAVRRSIYHRHIERWLKWFPLESFLVVSGENLVKNPLDELQKVEDFLGLEHKLSKNNFYMNKTRGFYCLRQGSKEKCLANSKGRKHPQIDPNILRKLHEFFRPHNQKFYDLVGRDFGWP